MTRLLASLAVLVVLASACTKDEGRPAAAKSPAPAAAAAPTPAPAPAPAAEPIKADLKTLKLAAAKGWEGEFNPNLSSWTYEKYTPGKDGTNEPNRFYVDAFPDDRPTDVEGYAAKLTSDKNFQDMGSLFISVASKEALPNGSWLITGVQKDMGDAEDKGAPAFVLYRKDLTTYCRGSVFKSEALRTEAIEACKAMKP